MAESLPILDRRDEVDRTLDEVLGHEYPPLMAFLAKAGQGLPIELEGHGLIIDADFARAEARRAREVYISWQVFSQRSTPIFSSTDPFPPGSIEEVRFSTSDRANEEQDKDQESVERLRAENSMLHKKILLLQAELRKNVPYLQLYRFGAGAFSLSVLSILVWLSTGIALPFHQAFALAAIPTSIGFMLMAYLTKKYNIDDSGMGNDRSDT